MRFHIKFTDIYGAPHKRCQGLKSFLLASLIEFCVASTTDEMRIERDRTCVVYGYMSGIATALSYTRNTHPSNDQKHIACAELRKVRVSERRRRRQPSCRGNEAKTTRQGYQIKVTEIDSIHCFIEPFRRQKVAHIRARARPTKQVHISMRSA